MYLLELFNILGNKVRTIQCNKQLADATIDKHKSKSKFNTYKISAMKKQGYVR